MLILVIIYIHTILGGGGNLFHYILMVIRIGNLTSVISGELLVIKNLVISVKLLPRLLYMYLIKWIKDVLFQSCQPLRFWRNHYDFLVPITPLRP